MPFDQLVDPRRGFNLGQVATARKHQELRIRHRPGEQLCVCLQGEFSDNTTRLRFMMPPVEQLEAAFGRHGIGTGTRVVLYSIGTMMWATRF
jgi:thiosulfate/3-mercaptopyruvate sulfurtransferase